ncbi:uncharacterized protein LOC144542987 [Centroberyx gerrardi]
MTSLGNIFGYIFPALVVSIAVVLLCFYLHVKRKRALQDITVPTQHDRSSSIQVIPLSGRQEEVDRHTNRLPPPYSTVDLPPPYSLFDPKLWSAWPGGPPPAYEMYPITLPLEPHHWSTPEGPPPPPPPPRPPPPPPPSTLPRPQSSPPAPTVQNPH